MHAYEIDPAENASPARIAELERERAARNANAFSLVVPTSDPQHGEIMGGIFSRLSAGAHRTPRIAGDVRRARDLKDFGEAYVRLVESRMPNYYLRAGII